MRKIDEITWIENRKKERKNGDKRRKRIEE